MSRSIVVGSRGSKLALIQAESVVAKIRETNQDIEVSISQIVTKGDRNRHVHLDQMASIGVFVKELEEAFDIACCRTGGTIAAKKVVAFFKAPLIETDYPEEVFQQGGIINVWHPFYNGHGFYLDTKCKDRGALRMINSLFGAPIMLNIGKREIQPWVTNRCGSHWKMV